MSQNTSSHRRERRHDSPFITAVAFGGFLIIVGIIFVSTPDLWQKITYFFDHFASSAVPLGNSSSNLILPAPANPSDHTVLYTALLQFDVAFGILQILILALRFWTRSSIHRISETLGNAVFWFGAAFLVNAFLLTGTLGGWFQYWAALIIDIGISLIVRAVVYFAKR